MVMKKKLLWGALFLSVIFFQYEISWALTQPGYMKIQIEGNDIVGESTVTSMEREGSIEVLAVSHKVSVPASAATGIRSGAPQYGVFTISKRIDKATPLLVDALAMNKNVNSVEIRFFRPSPGGAGAEEHYYTILMENCRIAEINTILPMVTDPAYGNHYQLMEQVSFTYNRITVTYENGGITSTVEVVR
jgi:type VI secretion system secreted protein Hcp